MYNRSISFKVLFWKPYHKDAINIIDKQDNKIIYFILSNFRKIINGMKYYYLL